MHRHRAFARPIVERGRGVISAPRISATLTSNLVRGLIAAALVLMTGVLVYRFVGVTALGAVLFGVVCGVVRLVLFSPRR